MRVLSLKFRWPALCILFIFFGSCAFVPDNDDPSLEDTFGSQTPGDMVLVPGGAFLMGSGYDPSLDIFSGEEDIGFEDERPQRTVFLSPFFIDQTEVTNGQYRSCVFSGACSDPAATSSLTIEDYYLNAAFDPYPVVNVTHDQAEDYCRWAQKRLPTEAEWEKAARGSLDERLFPWGHERPGCDEANISVFPIENSEAPKPCFGDTVRADEFADIPSFFGAVNLAGNVLEWVGDFYSETYYDGDLFPDNDRDPQGPAEGSFRVARGGSFLTTEFFARVSCREPHYPWEARVDIGFRCAKDY